MATFRTTGQDSYSIGSKPPTVTWTVVKGDTAAFRVYVTDDNKDPLVIADWDIEMEVKRPTVAGDIDSNTAAHVITVLPEAEIGDGIGEFTVSLTSSQSRSLNTGDIFDIELRDATRVWTVARGSMIIVEDITNNEES
jgi:hypothetical protein